MVYKKLCKLEKIKSQPQAEKKKKKITNKYHINKDHNPITTHHKTPFTIDYTQFGVGRDSNCPTWDVLQRPDFQTTKLNFLLTIRPPSDHNFFFFFPFRKTLIFIGIIGKMFIILYSFLVIVTVIEYSKNRKDFLKVRFNLCLLSKTDWCSQQIQI